MQSILARWALLTFMCLTGAMGLLPATTASANEKDLKKYGPIPWQGSLKTAMKIAAREKKPIFVDFWAEWCGPCKVMLAHTYTDKAVVARSKGFVPVLINAEEQPEVLKKLGLEGVPVVLFLDAKGKILLQSTGYESPKTFLVLMKQAAKKFK